METRLKELERAVDENLKLYCQLRVRTKYKSNRAITYVVIHTLS